MLFMHFIHAKEISRLDNFGGAMREDKQVD